MDLEAKEEDESEEETDTKFSEDQLKKGEFAIFLIIVEFSKINHFFEFFKFLESYSAENLKRKTAAMVDVVKKLEQDALKKEEQGECDLSDDGEFDEEMVDEGADIARDVFLPSNMDSKLWRLKVQKGMERQLVFRLTNKLIN